ncbi:hypothetical protein [Couchioplanes caeruleus]|uniref:Uncharacterized protein n=2 Tax=Couchioplanes caeruleus TaxID=56438 RepID=A0A1K0H123_9ACTN|nr:hypothetical protein [Couchioplanes caeruleus]OJF15403.1 hypothetical protein BG844_04695 [Couchioplanes caeruleus subsp. caeruleus]ROP33444.1 hypothetical protein EDD30_6426 [Couchioplanes caeruleus]
MTQYRSLADPYLLPGWKAEWLTQLSGDVLLNVVVELKHYGTRPGPQSVGGRTVLAPTMMIQRRNGVGVPAYGYGQVLAGHIDPLLDRLRVQLTAMPHPEMINVQFASEFDTDHEFGVIEHCPLNWPEADARAVASVRYMAGYLLDGGIPAGVTFSIGCGGFDRPSFRRLHPASLAGVLDRMQFNAYNHGTARTPYDVLNRTKAWITDDLDPRWHRKPIIIAEYGTAASLGSQAAWLAGVPGAIDRMESDGRPFVEALVYFDSNPEWATLNPRPEGLQALHRAYSTTPLAPASRPALCARAR